MLAAAEPAVAVPVDTGVVKRDEFVRETVLTLDLKARHRPLAKVEFAVSDPFFVCHVTVMLRELENGEFVERHVASGAISRSQLPPSPPREALLVPLSLKLNGRELEFHVANGSNAPLAIERVIVRRHPVRLILCATTGGT